MSENESLLITKQQETKITNYLREKGIGRSYFYKNFSDIKSKPSEECKNWVLSCDDDLAAGKALTIVGRSDEAYDLFMLTMRGLILRPIPARVFSFIGLLTDQEHIDKFLSNKAHVIGISGFFPDSSRIDPQQYAAFENLLLKKYMDEMIPIVFHMPTEFTTRPAHGDHAVYGDCVSPFVIDRIFKLNKIVQV